MFVTTQTGLNVIDGIPHSTPLGLLLIRLHSPGFTGAIHIGALQAPRLISADYNRAVLPFIANVAGRGKHIEESIYRLVAVKRTGEMQIA